MNVIITRRVSRFGDSALTSFILHSLLHLPCLTFIPRRVSRFGDSALTSFILHSLLHLACLTFSFTYLLLPTESSRRETLCAYFLYTTFSPSLALPYFFFHLSPASDRVPEARDSAVKKQVSPTTASNGDENNAIITGYRPAHAHRLNPDYALLTVLSALHN
ncbi:MAG: hypothetical protein IM610_08135 [Cytophagales bacterium]|nr:hypothetical protein [Cytophagales bacterium]